MGNGLKSAQFLIERRLIDAARGDANALYDLGIVYSMGTSEHGIDLIAAHKWFNLAAVSGMTAAAEARADVAEDMTAREIAEAQRQARAWLGATRRLAA
jgi:hypothetical protein